MRILIIKLSAIGDCLLASPVASALRNSFPDAHIGWAVHPHCAPVIRDNPNLDRVHLVPRKSLMRGILSVAPEIRQEKYDTAIDLQGLFKSGIVARMSGAKTRYGPVEAREGAGIFYTDRILRGLDSKEHVVRGYLRFAEAVGASWDTEPPMLMPYTEPDLEHVRGLFQEFGIAPSEELVVLNPSAGKVIKQWSPLRFAAVGNALLTEPNRRVLITGAPSDAPLGEAILAAMPDHSRVTNLIGKTNLNQLAALFSQVRLFVGGDTGPMHIAQAAGTRVLAIFGPTDPTILGPRDPKHRIVHMDLAGPGDPQVAQVTEVAEQMLRESA